MDSVGVRELKQNASAVLRRVGAGETLQVTDRGRPVALLVPIPPADDVVARLVAEGRATAPKGSLADLPPPLRPKPGRPLPSQILAELRADER
jgi:prevent-host-death family protein